MKEKYKKVLKVVILLVCFFGTVMLGTTVIVGFSDAEQYLRVYQNPLVVTATVTEYEDYDDDGDTDYRSYVTYYVDGIRYSRIKYESADRKEQLTPIGDQVVIEVNPEAPFETLDEMKISSFGSAIVMFIFVVPFFAYMCSVFIAERRSKDFSYIDEKEKIQKDALLTVWGRLRVILFLFLIIYSALLYFRYKVIYGNISLFILRTVVCVEIYCIIIAILQTIKIKRNEIAVRRAILVDKEISEGDESTSYFLYYECDGKIKKESTSCKLYNSSQMNETVYYIFINGKKKPLLYYNASGKAVTSSMF